MPRMLGWYQGQRVEWFTLGISKSYEWSAIKGQHDNVLKVNERDGWAHQTLIYWCSYVPKANKTNIGGQQSYHQHHANIYMNKYGRGKE